MSGEVDRSQHVLPLEQPVVYLEAQSAFDGLSSKEKLYAHHLGQASWIGGLVTFLQTSPESGPVFVLVHKLFCAEKPALLAERALKAGFTEEEVGAFFVYVCGLFSNAGNYKGFGDTKFVPGIEQERLEQLLKASPVWKDLESLWCDLKDPLYDLSAGRTCLGYSPLGCSTYLSKNCTSADNEKVQAWLKKRKLECYNTRCFKTVANGAVEFEIRIAGEERGLIEKEEVDGCIFRLTKGDYSPLMKKIAGHLEEAVPHAANAIQAEMLKAYVRSFTKCSLDEHKQGSRLWIQDKGPAVETYIGFIETYRDPAGVRGEFEGFVAVVNRAMSAKFATLVDSAQDLLPLLPWPKGFEKDTFLRPDFTSLDVLTFAGSGIPAGINIPNYDEIRQSEGFKNVSLGNVIPASYQQSQTPFLCDLDKDLLQKYRVMSFELQVGLHELLGHGSGKLLRKEADGNFNFSDALLDPLTGNRPLTWYEPGDTYDARFGPLSSAYEECRAEAVGLYLSLEPSVLSIFGHKEQQQAEDVMYVNWLALVWAGVCGLEMWEPGRGWLQAHSQARFALARVLIQAGVASVTQPQPQDLLVTLDRTGIKGAGRVAIGQFLLQLQVYKATGDVEAARKSFAHYSEVTEPWKSWRDIVLANKRPRKMFAQPNTILQGEDVHMRGYDASTEGLITSWVERFPEPEPLYKALQELSKMDAHHFI